METEMNRTSRESLTASYTKLSGYLDEMAISMIDQVETSQPKAIN